MSMVWKLAESRPWPTMILVSTDCFVFFSCLIGTVIWFWDTDCIRTKLPPVSLKSFSLFMTMPLIIQPCSLIAKHKSDVLNSKLWKQDITTSSLEGRATLTLGAPIPISRSSRSSFPALLSASFFFYNSYILFWSSIFLLLNSNYFSEASLDSASTLRSNYLVVWFKE